MLGRSRNCLRAYTPLGIAVEGQTGLQEGLVGVKGIAGGPATGVLGVSAAGAGVSGFADQPGGAGVRAEGRGGADGVFAITSGVNPQTQLGVRRFMPSPAITRDSQACSRGA